MKMKVALVAAALALLGATSAQAQLTLTLDAPVDLGGGVFQYGGTLTNDYGFDVQVNSSNISIPNGVVYSDTIGDLVLGDLPLHLTKNGGFYSTNEFFTLTVPNGFAGGSGLYGFEGQNAESTFSILVTSNGAEFPIPGFTDNGGGGHDVPEPGSVALLTGMLASGGLFVARRRK